jgi:hypothetical protein
LDEEQESGILSLQLVVFYSSVFFKDMFKDKELFCETGK